MTFAGKGLPVRQGVGRECSRGHKIEGRNARARANDVEQFECVTCRYGLYYARRHNLFADSDRVIEYMENKYRELMDVSEGEV